METEKYEVWVLLRHYWKQNYKAAAAVKRTCDAECEDAVNERMAQQWLKRFVSGNLSLEDEQCPGRPSAGHKERANRKKRSSSASGGTTKVLFIMDLCQMAIRST
jgi:hypothetical protein